MKPLNNALIMILKPAMPFLEWIAGLGAVTANKPPAASFDLEAMTQMTAVMIPQKPDLTIFNEFLIDHAAELLEHEFSRWTKDTSYWPLRNDAEILLEYCQLEIYENIVDLRNDDLQYYRIAILRPTSQLKDWLKNILKSTGTYTKALDLENTDPFQAVSTAYLLPESVKFVSEAVQFFREEYARLFEYELNRYITDRQYWPVGRDQDLFWQWFEMDLYQKPLVL